MLISENSISMETFSLIAVVTKNWWKKIILMATQELDMKHKGVAAVNHATVFIVLSNQTDKNKAPASL